VQKQRWPDISLAQESVWLAAVYRTQGRFGKSIAYFEQLLSDKAFRAQLVEEPTAMPG
jgi:hypothetical protein